MLDDDINHPKHYTSGGIEVIDAIEAWDLPYHLGNVVKYVARAGKKSEDPTKDLQKAAWYLSRAIEKLPDRSLVMTSRHLEQNYRELGPMDYVKITTMVLCDHSNANIVHLRKVPDEYVGFQVRDYYANDVDPLQFFDPVKT